LKSCLMYPVLSGVRRRGSQLPVPVDGPKTNVPPGQKLAVSAPVMGTNAFDASLYLWFPNTLKQRSEAPSGGGVGFPKMSTEGATCVVVLPVIGVWTVIGL